MIKVFPAALTPGRVGVKGAHGVGGCVVLRAGLDECREQKISCSCRNFGSTYDTSMNKLWTFRGSCIVIYSYKTNEMQ